MSNQRELSNRQEISNKESPLKEERDYQSIENEKDLKEYAYIKSRDIEETAQKTIEEGKRDLDKANTIGLDKKEETRIKKQSGIEGEIRQIHDQINETSAEARQGIKDIIEEKETGESEKDYYTESTNEFIGSLEQDPQFKKLTPGDKKKFTEEIQAASQEYQQREKSLIGKIGDFIDNCIEEYKKSRLIRGITFALILETTLFGLATYEQGKRYTDPEFNLIAKVASFTKEARREIFLTQKEKEEIEEQNLIDYLKQKIPSEIIDKIRNLKSIANENERKQIPDTMPAFENIEELCVLKEEMKSVLSTFPNGFNSNLKKISYIDKIKPMPKYYGQTLIDENKEGAAGEAVRSEQEIKFFQSIKESPVYDMLEEYLPHELGHLNDWESNKFLTQKERLELLKTIIERVEHPRRVKFNYVEKIQNTDKKCELYAKTAEYFAEIISSYFSFSSDILPQEDNKIIESLIKKTDPEYKVTEKKQQRREIISEIRYNSEEEETVIIDGHIYATGNVKKLRNRRNYEKSKVTKMGNS